MYLQTLGTWWAGLLTVPYGAGGCGGRGLWVLIPIFSPPPSGFFHQGFEGCCCRTLLWGGVHWSNPWVHWSNPLVNWSNQSLSGSTPGAWVISPDFVSADALGECSCSSCECWVSAVALTPLRTYGLKLHECVGANSMGLFARAWCKKRTFHCPGKYDAKKATILSHLRIFRRWGRYTADLRR